MSCDACGGVLDVARFARCAPTGMSSGRMQKLLGKITVQKKKVVQIAVVTRSLTAKAEKQERGNPQKQKM